MSALDKASLQAAALSYLERYSSSTENLRRVLMRRVKKACRDNEDAQEAIELAAIVDAIVERYVASGLVDDRAFARGRAATLARRGDSRRAIVHKLRGKGVADTDARAALDDIADGATPDAVDLESAWNYARKRRLGPYRLDPEIREARREKDLAALCRRGFSYGIASAVIRAEAPR